MSIALVQPSLLLNSFAFTDGFGGCGMFMTDTWNCPKSTQAADIVRWILHSYNHTSDKHLHHVVFNFHGPGEDAKPEDYDKIQIGEASPESGFHTNHFVEATYYTLDLSNVGLFSALKGKNIGTIWLHSCAIARTYKGKYFCQRLAECSGCNVVAAADDQEEWWPSLNYIFMHRGSIDDYEGAVYIWKPNGHSSRFYPNGGNWT